MDVKGYGGGVYFRELIKVFVRVKLEMPVSYPKTDVKQAVGFRTGAQKSRYNVTLGITTIEMVSKAPGNLMSSGKRGPRPESGEELGSLSEQVGEFKSLSRWFDLI